MSASLDVRIEVNEHDVRRINAVCSVEESIKVRVTKEKITLIGDSMTHFKSYSLKCKSSKVVNFSIDSNSLLNICSKGVLGLNISPESVHICSSSVPEDFDKGVYRTITQTPCTTLEDYMLRDYLVILNGIKSDLLYIKELTNLKDIIKVCSACKVGVEISGGVMKTMNNLVSMFKLVDDKELRIGLDVSALKQIESFGTDCRMHNVGGYLVLSRDEYVLGVRKVAISDVKFPDYVYSDISANSCHVVSLKGVYELIKTYSKANAKLAKGFLQVDCDTQRVQVFNGRSQYVMQSQCRQIDCCSNIGVSKIRLPLSSLSGLGVLSDADNVVVYTYGKLVRLKIKSDINLLIAGEVS